MPFDWGEAQDISFRTIIQKLSNPPVIAYADNRRSFILHIDASTSGLGAVLYQEHIDFDYVIAYANRSLKPSERIYPT